jgi:hypothetical protein
MAFPVFQGISKVPSRPLPRLLARACFCGALGASSAWAGEPLPAPVVAASTGTTPRNAPGWAAHVENPPAGAAGGATAAGVARAGAGPAVLAEGTASEHDTPRLEEPGAGRAQGSFALDLSASTWVPVSVGPEATLEVPGRLLLQVHVGWMPDLYGHALTDTLEDAGAIDARSGALVDGAVRGATTWRLAAGWRPLPKSGLELTVGYAHIAGNGQTSTGELLPLVPPDVGDRLRRELGDTDIHLRSSIHHFTLAAGWRWLIADRIVIRADLGYLQAFAADSTLGIDSRPDLARLAQPTVQSVLHGQYMRYIKVPIVGFGVGYRFF